MTAATDGHTALVMTRWNCLFRRTQIRASVQGSHSKNEIPKNLAEIYRDVSPVGKQNARISNTHYSFLHTAMLAGFKLAPQY